MSMLQRSKGVVTYDAFTALRGLRIGTIYNFDLNT